MERGTNANRVAIIGWEREERVIESEREGVKDRKRERNIQISKEKQRIRERE